MKSCLPASNKSTLARGHADGFLYKNMLNPLILHYYKSYYYYYYVVALVRTFQLRFVACSFVIMAAVLLKASVSPDRIIFPASQFSGLEGSGSDSMHKTALQAP